MKLVHVIAITAILTLAVVATHDSDQLEVVFPIKNIASTNCNALFTTLFYSALTIGDGTSPAADLGLYYPVDSKWDHTRIIDWNFGSCSIDYDEGKNTYTIKAKGVEANIEADYRDDEEETDKYITTVSDSEIIAKVQPFKVIKHKTHDEIVPEEDVVDGDDDNDDYRWRAYVTKWTNNPKIKDAEVDTLLSVVSNHHLSNYLNEYCVDDCENQDFNLLHLLLEVLEIDSDHGADHEGQQIGLEFKLDNEVCQKDEHAVVVREEDDDESNQDVEEKTEEINLDEIDHNEENKIVKKNDKKNECVCHRRVDVWENEDSGVEDESEVIHVEEGPCMHDDAEEEKESVE